MSSEAPRLQIVIEATPSRNLSPNVKCHWMIKARDAKKLKELAYWSARNHIQSSSDAASLVRSLKHAKRIAYTVAVSWEKGRRGTQDEDNTLASLKAALDGVAQAIGRDDKCFTIRGVETERSQRLGTTTITLWDASAE